MFKRKFNKWIKNNPKWNFGGAIVVTLIISHKKSYCKSFGILKVFRPYLLTPTQSGRWDCRPTLLATHHSQCSRPVGATASKAIRQAAVPCSIPNLQWAQWLKVPGYDIWFGWVKLILFLLIQNIPLLIAMHLTTVYIGSRQCASVDFKLLDHCIWFTGTYTEIFRT